jgi:hypothetical protein
MQTMKRVALAAATLLMLGALSTTPALAAGGGGSTGTRVIYSSLAGQPLPGNLLSEGAEAYAFDEFGNEITFAKGPRDLSNVVITMSSWACASGNWYSDNCSTPPGATFAEPITLNIYRASQDGVTPGSLIASVTQTFNIPYRPSASPTCDARGDTGEWYQQKTRTCYHGLATNITFDFGAMNVTLPDTVVYGISYNTEHYGYAPSGPTACDSPAYSNTADCPYDSLNIALSTGSNVTVGIDPVPGTVWQNSPYGSLYCDSGSAGTGFFRLDSPGSPCWAPYVPAVQFKAGSSTS